MSTLNNIVSPLVDSLSLLVLECVGGSLKDVTTHCMALASNTQALVDQAQKVAMATDDNEVVNEIINSINIIADQIGELVGSFQQLLTNRTDPGLVKNFSTTAQNVADAINGLVNVTDETSQKRLIGLVRYATQVEVLSELVSVRPSHAISGLAFFYRVPALPTAAFALCDAILRVSSIPPPFTAFHSHLRARTMIHFKRCNFPISLTFSALCLRFRLL